MKRGRPPKPTKLRLIEGNREHRALNMNEPQYASCHEPPECMTPDAKIEWYRLAPKLLGQGLLTEADRAAFTAYCEEWATYSRLTARIADLLQQKEPDQTDLMRLMRLRSSTFKNLGISLSRFGFSPADRARITASPPKVQENSLLSMLKPINE